jgi:hypothetical protein
MTATRKSCSFSHDYTEGHSPNSRVTKAMPGHDAECDDMGLMPVFDCVQNRFEKYILRLIPSDILRKGKLCVIGNGVVVDPIALWEEITYSRCR